MAETVEIPVIGVVGAPNLVQAFTDIGFRVADGRPAVESGLRVARFPVIAADTDEAGAAAWSTAVAAYTTLISLRTRPQDPPVLGARLVDLPATVNDLMPLIGYQPSPALAGGTVILPDTPPAADSDPNLSFDQLMAERTAAVEATFVQPVGRHAAPWGERQEETAPPPVATPPEVAPQPPVVPLDAPTAPERPLPPATPAPYPPTPAVTQPTVAPVLTQYTDSGSVWSDTGQAEPGPAAAGTGAAVTALNSARVVISYAGKGGVGKTSFAVSLAQRAAAAGLTVVLVDMNRGQGDIRSYLHLDDPNLPSIYTAAVNGRPADAFISPERLNNSRLPTLPKLGFGAVLAPPHTLADPQLVTAEVYNAVIASLHADLIVIDTQIAEAHDTSGLIGSVVIPALTGGGFGLGVTDMSKPGLENLLERTKDFVTRGVPRTRLLFTVNKAADLSARYLDEVTHTFEPYATFVGAAGTNRAFAAAMNRGEVEASASAVSAVVDAALLAVTGSETFKPAPRKRKLFGRRR